MIDPAQLRALVVRPTLHAIRLYSPAAEDLLIGTAVQESGLRHLRQMGDGPARGLWQIEPATHRDVWENYLAYREEMASRVRGLASQHAWMDDFDHELVFNLAYACAIARLVYYRDPHPLPHHGDVEGYAACWKRVYNTPQGAGTEEEFLNNWYNFVEDS